MAQEELQESKLTKAGGRKPTHGCNYPMVGWPSVILTPMGPSLNLTREGTSRPSLRSSLSLSLSCSFHALPCLHWAHGCCCCCCCSLCGDATSCRCSRCCCCCWWRYWQHPPTLVQSAFASTGLHRTGAKASFPIRSIKQGTCSAGTTWLLLPSPKRVPSALSVKGPH